MTARDVETGAVVDASLPPPPRVPALTKWRLRRRLARAAALLKRGRISQVDYAVVAADVVSRLQFARGLQTGDLLKWLVFPLEALFALGATPATFGDAKFSQFGPLNEVPFMLGEHFGTYGNGGDSQDKERSAFVWGKQSDDLLWRAVMRLRWSGRWMERFDQWKARQEAFAPKVHGDIWRVILAVLGMVVTYVLGRLQIP